MVIASRTRAGRKSREYSMAETEYRSPRVSTIGSAKAAAAEKRRKRGLD
jgi:hypothetical protein